MYVCMYAAAQARSHPAMKKSLSLSGGGETDSGTVPGTTQNGDATLKRPSTYPPPFPPPPEKTPTFHDTFTTLPYTGGADAAE